MFELTNAPGPIRPDLRTALEETWRWLAQPGTWWTATERQDIAAVGRAIRPERLGNHPGFQADDHSPPSDEAPFT